jgi:hypothetical protein
MPEGKDFDPARVWVDLVVEVIAGPAQEETPDTVLLRVPSPCPDARLNRNQLECSIEVVCHGKRS